MKHVAWCLAALFACAACDPPGGSGGDPPDVSVPGDVGPPADGGLDGTPGPDGGHPDAGPPDQGADTGPPDQGPPDHGPAASPQRPGRLQWTGGPHGRGLPTFDYTGAGVRLRGSLTP